ncbi:Hypothetical_protein [Hexamita inflata]|uniref:Hypothetical_protein n=1 Tax=Hexamita inflata TaxID=28002 RepID=A0AA86UER4_9EUKA|nr:Hypothetical protein HINF_LOCUS25878 [Hexamita inflata]
MLTSLVFVFPASTIYQLVGDLLMNSDLSFTSKSVKKSEDSIIKLFSTSTSASISLIGQKQNKLFSDISKYSKLTQGLNEDQKQLHVNQLKIRFSKRLNKRSCNKQLVLNANRFAQIINIKHLCFHKLKYDK